MSEISFGKRFARAMQKHSNDAVENNAITRMNSMGVVTVAPIDGSNIYTIKINDEIFKIPARSNLDLSVGNIVIIMYFNGNSNQSWIIDEKDWNCW